MSESRSKRHDTMHPEVHDSTEWLLFRRFHQAMQGHRQLMGRMLAERGIHPAQALCLKELAHNDGMTQRDLAEVMCISRPTVTVMLQKMETAGLVERQTDPADQRYTRITLTESGWQRHAEMHELLDAFNEVTMGALSAEEQVALAGLLGTLNEHFAEALGGSVSGKCHGPIDDMEKDA